MKLWCSDVPGIVADVSTYLFRSGCNILAAQQFDDSDTGRFFMRVVFAGAEGRNEPAEDGLRADRVLAIPFPEKAAGELRNSSVKGWRASKALSRKNSSALPWRLLVPDLVTTFTTPPRTPPYSALSLWNCTLNS